MRVAPQLYDLDPRDMLTRDIPFYLRRFEAPSHVLDVGVGTGRIALALARRGFTVTGIDPDSHMLAQATSHLWHETPDVQSRVRLICSNINDYTCSQRYKYIIFGHRTFQAIIGPDSQHRALARAADCLTDDGYIVVSLPAEFDEISTTWPGTTTTDWSIETSGIRICRRTDRLSVDLTARSLNLHLVYKIQFSDGSEMTINEPLVLAHISDSDFRKAASKASLEIEHAYGSYNESHLGQGGEMIYVLRRQTSIAP